METAGHSETSLWDRLEAFQSISATIAGAQDLERVADQALGLALELTGASVAFIGKASFGSNDASAAGATASRFCSGSPRYKRCVGSGDANVPT